MENQTTTGSKKRYGAVVFEANPFLDPYKIKTKEKRITGKKENMVMVKEDDGQVVGQAAGFWTSKTVDSEQFVKLFVEGVRQLADLTNAGTKVLAIVLEEVQKNLGRDLIYLNSEMVGGRISQPTYSRGIKELIEKDFIAAAKLGMNWWYINPNFIFNGDRLRFVIDYDKSSAKKKTIQGRVAEQIEHKDNMTAEAEQMKNGG